MPRFMQSLFISAALATSPLLISPALQAAEATAASTFSQQEIEQLVAPIALYPDALLAQVLMASTYPLEVVQASRWRSANPKLKDKALEDALQKQNWDPAVKSLAVFPDVLQMMNDKIDWTQKLGDAFLAQQKDVMEASQRLRAKAVAEGNLKTSKEQKVTTESSGNSSTIYKIEPQTETIYVPVYNPTVVYGTWPYPYYTPYYWYPPTYPYGSAAFGFTTGVIVGAAIWGNCNWGNNDINIDIDRYNNFNRVEHYDRDNDNKWEHNPDHRRGVEYRDKQTREQFRPNSSNRDLQRDDFRGKADASRGDLKHVDRNEVSNRSKEQHGQRDHGTTTNRANDRVGQTDRNLSDQNRAVSNHKKHSATRDNAFSGADRGQANRAASTRGASSQRSMSRPPRTGRR